MYVQDDYGFNTSCRIGFGRNYRMLALHIYTDRGRDCLHMGQLLIATDIYLFLGGIATDRYRLGMNWLIDWLPSFSFQSYLAVRVNGGGFFRWIVAAYLAVHRTPRGETQITCHCNHKGNIFVFLRSWPLLRSDGRDLLPFLFERTLLHWQYPHVLEAHHRPAKSFAYPWVSTLEKFNGYS